MASTQTNCVDPVSIRLTPDQAKHVADIWTVLFSIEEHSIESREQVAEIRAYLADNEKRLEQVAWGHPDGPVEITLPRDEIKKLAEDLIEEGTDMSTTEVPREGMTLPETRRYYFGRAELGFAILDQLEATR